jgi:hypothetical protein
LTEQPKDWGARLGFALMPRDPVNGKIEAVTVPTLTVTLELELDGETLTGKATDGNGTVREFTGWVGLLGAIDLLCEPCGGFPRQPDLGRPDRNQERVPK